MFLRECFEILICRDAAKIGLITLLAAAVFSFACSEQSLGPQDLGITGNVDPGQVQPLPYVNNLCQNYPNPFNPTTTIRYSVAEFTHVSLRIYTDSGELVHTLVNEVKESDHYEVRWDGRNDQGSVVASGSYFYVLTVKDWQAAKKMLLLK